MQILANQQALATCELNGTPNGPITWSLDNPAVATLTPSADGTTCMVTAAGVGSATLSCTDTVLTANAAVVVTAVPVPATTMSISFGPAMPIPAPAPAPTPAPAA